MVADVNALPESRAFELQLRRLADSMFDREPDKTSYWARFHSGEMPYDEVREMYYRRWSWVMAFNRVLLAQLITKAPSFKSRMEVLRVIAPEFGALSGVHAHPTMYRKFLLAMGVPESDLGWSANSQGGGKTPPLRMDEWMAMSWIELLGFMLYIETVGPVLFAREGEILQTKYGLSPDDVEYFHVHSTHDKIDSELLFAQLRRECVTEADKQTALRTLKNGYEVSGARVARWPGTLAYRFVPIFDPTKDDIAA